VDIPEVRRAFILASTTNPKQFIQRRGRVLRRAPGKAYAEIFDFVVVPPDPDQLPDDVAALEQRMFRKELMRIVEFTKLAVNGSDALASLLPVRQAYNLLDV
jgi:superfamily II DNA or RNA helicase